MRESAANGVNAYSSKLSDMRSKAQTIIDSVKNLIRNSGSGFYSAGEQLGDNFGSGMVRGMNNKISSIVSKAQSVVNQAIAAAKKAAGVNSPSKITTKMFEEVGEGMIVGLDNKEQEVITKMHKVVSASLDIDTSMLKEKMRVNVPDVQSRFERTVSSNSTVRHTGTIRVEGVNDRGQLESVVDIVVNSMRREARL